MALQRPLICETAHSNMLPLLYAEGVGHFLKSASEYAKGRSVEKSRAKRNQIQVDIETAHPAVNRCYGYVDNISGTGISIVLREGELPARQRSVILNFKIWTGREILYRKIYARRVSPGQGKIALEFTRSDFNAMSIIRELMFYQRNNDKTSRAQAYRYSSTPDRLTA